VDDLVDGLIRMMNSPVETIGPLNLGNPVEFTMLELAEKVLHFTNSTSKLVFLPLPQDDPKQRQPDISKTRAKLDWSPKVELDEGLLKTIAYFKKVVA
jgi:UDP-glucuronate decarboxylase